MTDTETDETANRGRWKELRALATTAAAQAYAPYSQFRVGAALLLTDGTIVTGCNVEICSYRLTCCAEQSAMVQAVSEYGPAVRLRAVAVANLNGAASMPCGACRQTLAEFGDDEVIVLCPGEEGEEVETTLGALLPQAFRLTQAPPSTHLDASAHLEAHPDSFARSDHG